MKKEGVFDPPNIGSEKAYPIKFIHIDDLFLKNYGNVADLPYIKGGDHIFLVYAKVNDIPLITRDKKLFQVARACGARVFLPEEYMRRVGVGSKFDLFGRVRFGHSISVDDASWLAFLSEDRSRPN